MLHLIVFVHTSTYMSYCSCIFLTMVEKTVPADVFFCKLVFVIELSQRTRVCVHAFFVCLRLQCHPAESLRLFIPHCCSVIFRITDSQYHTACACVCLFV